METTTEKITTIGDLAEFEVTPKIDHIEWYVDDYDNEKEGTISHEDFRPWVESNGYLNMEQLSYELCDVVQWTISYCDLLTDDDLNKIVFKYLVEKDLI